MIKRPESLDYGFTPPEDNNMEIEGGVLHFSPKQNKMSIYPESVPGSLQNVTPSEVFKATERILRALTDSLNKDTHISALLAVINGENSNREQFSQVLIQLQNFKLKLPAKFLSARKFVQDFADSQATELRQALLGINDDDESHARAQAFSIQLIYLVNQLKQRMSEENERDLIDQLELAINNVKNSLIKWYGTQLPEINIVPASVAPERRHGDSKSSIIFPKSILSLVAAAALAFGGTQVANANPRQIDPNIDSEVEGIQPKNLPDFVTLSNQLENLQLQLKRINEIFATSPVNQVSNEFLQQTEPVDILIPTASIVPGSNWNLRTLPNSYANSLVIETLTAGTNVNLVNANSYDQTKLPADIDVELSSEDGTYFFLDQAGIKWILIARNSTDAFYLFISSAALDVDYRRITLTPAVPVPAFTPQETDISQGSQSEANATETPSTVIQPTRAALAPSNTTTADAPRPQGLDTETSIATLTPDQRVTPEGYLAGDTSAFWYKDRLFEVPTALNNLQEARGVFSDLVNRMYVLEADGTHTRHELAQVFGVVVEQNSIAVTFTNILGRRVNIPSFTIASPTIDEDGRSRWQVYVVYYTSSATASILSNNNLQVFQSDSGRGQWTYVGDEGLNNLAFRANNRTYEIKDGDAVGLSYFIDPETVSPAMSRFVTAVDDLRPQQLAPTLTRGNDPEDMRVIMKNFVINQDPE